MEQYEEILKPVTLLSTLTAGYLNIVEWFCNLSFNKAATIIITCLSIVSLFFIIRLNVVKIKRERMEIKRLQKQINNKK